MNIMDSSAWLEVVAQGPNALRFLAVIEAGELVVPSITIFEVVKRMAVQGVGHAVPQVESHMRRFPVVELTADRASAAAALSVQHKLPMADSIIYAAALEFNATVWTQDADFEGLPQARYLAKA